MKFVKKPIVVDATRWFKSGDHPEDFVGMEVPDGDGGVYHRGEGLVVRYFRGPFKNGEDQCKHCKKLLKDHGFIDTLEGGHIVCPGDWIITGVSGERYPCKPDIFEKTYEKIT